MDHDEVAGIDHATTEWSRRALLSRLAAAPIAGGLAALLAEDGDARRRKHRRRARRRHDDRERKPHKKRCRNKATLCATRCGPHKKKRCKKPVDCGPCRVFVSSTTHSGNLGGLSGADTTCQNLANAAGLPGTYRAWLSDNTQSPSTRFATSTGAYALVNGVTIAASWTDLTDGTLASPITVTELGGAFSDKAARVARMYLDDCRLLIAASLAGGWGAVFGVPFTGIAFMLQVTRRHRWQALPAAAVSAFTGKLVVDALGYEMGNRPHMPAAEWTIGLPFKLLLAGVVFGLVARMFVWALHLVKAKVAHRIKWPPARPLLGAAGNPRRLANRAGLDPGRRRGGRARRGRGRCAPSGAGR